jgi:(1->4)-alpha-D-glucan 1-alpha-D-glucosylmutase
VTGRPPIPGATYRLQLGSGLSFPQAAALASYLSDLGVTDVYLSPILQPGSEGSPGYDVADHGRINDSLGGEAGFRRLAAALAEHGLGRLVDIVPNHMGIASPRNAWWQSVLEHGPASPRAGFFDIDWSPPKPELRNRLLLPILEDHYGRVLERQDLRLHYAEGAFSIRYGPAVLPISPHTYPMILAGRLPELERAVGPGDPHLQELATILETAQRLPRPDEANPARRAERIRGTTEVKQRLASLTQASMAVKGLVEDALFQLNGTAGRPESFDRLDALLSAQPYRVSYWGVAGDEINYRRFFDVNDLAAIRMEDPEVFEATHGLLVRLVREGLITGLRVDHPDGLYSPARYFQALQEACAGPPAGDPAGRPPFYVVVEKILFPGEPLPDHWPVHGTTGYELLNALNGIFVDPRGVRALDHVYQRFTGLSAPFPEVAHRARRLVTETTMAGEFEVLGRRLARLAERGRDSRDFTGRILTDALRELVASFPVYRTYVGDEGPEVKALDRRHVEDAVVAAKRQSPTTNPSVFDFIGGLLTDGRHLDFARRFQQLTGPVAAKGVEDTAFYRYNRLLSLNEVGGWPDRGGTSLADFHRVNAERLSRWPHALSATSTHDTKRSEDVRARINVLSEIPLEWRAHVRTWHRVNRRHLTLIDGRPAPDPNEEYGLYQALVGAWPLGPMDDAAHAAFTERIQQYVFKALREAKVHTSWVHARPAYDAAVRDFVARILDRAGSPPAPAGRLRRLVNALVPEAAGNPFLADFWPFQTRVASAALYTSLSQSLLKLVVPGVPDIYQGTEAWDFSLVDPDNRRPVDHARLAVELAAIRAALAEPGGGVGELARTLLARKEDGRVKLYVTHRGLDLRRRHPRLFQQGAYLPVEVRGTRRDHVVAVGRQLEGQGVLAVVPRFVARLNLAGPPVGPGLWTGTWLALPESLVRPAYWNVLTGQEVPVGVRDGRPALGLESVLESFPVALLRPGPDPAGSIP